METLDELKSKTKEEDEKFYQLIMNKLPINDIELVHIISDIEKEINLTYTVNSLEEKIEDMVRKGYISKRDTIFGYRYEKANDN